MNRIFDSLPIKKIGVAFFLTLLSVYFLVTMEWAFFATKPSFLTSVSTVKLFEALFIVSLSFFVTAIFVLAVLSGFAAVLSSFNPIFKKTSIRLLLLPSTLLLSLTVMLLFDNFTNTVFGYGISKSGNFIRVLYLLGMLYVFYKTLVKLNLFLNRDLLMEKAKLMGVISAVIIIVSVAFSYSGVLSGQREDSNRGMNIKSKETAHNLKQQHNLPNILFYAADGISANLLSSYGNKHITTPHLDKFIDRALVARNAFTNSERTTGSTTSMLSGKYPTTTKVLFPPHILQGQDAYQHLPGLLKRLGYSTFQESVRYYADGNDLNFLDGFDLANGIDNGKILPWIFLQVQHANLMADKIVERISQRIKHITFIEKMPDVYSTVKSDGFAKVYGFSDRSRADKALDFIRESKDPFFMHLHFMDTHCCRYRPKERIFSTGEFTSKSDKRKALLLDLLRENDTYFGEIIAQLRDSNKLENTLIVYSSDHTEGWDFPRSVPLVFIFPNAEHTGTIMENTQLLDVAPTILDYLDIETPEWMEGESLLSASLDSNRPIFGVTQLQRIRFRSDKKDRLSRIVGAGPPNFGLNIMGLAVCDTWFLYNIKKDLVESGKVEGHSGGCDPVTQPTPNEAKEMMREHLLSKRFLGSS